MSQTDAPPGNRALIEAEIAEADLLAGDDPVHIGLITPMTAPGDDGAGLLFARGARLGVEYLHEQGGILGGRGVRLKIRNDMATAETDGFGPSAAAEATKFAMFDDVVALLGQWHLRTAPYVAEVCERFGLPVFIENGHSTVTHGRRSVFRTYFSCADRVPMMARFIASTGAKRVAMLAADTVFGQEIADAMVDEGKAAGLEILRLDFPQEETLDWKDHLQQIKDWGPDFFVNDGVNVSADRRPPGNAHRIAVQATEVGLLPHTPMMVTFGFPMRSADYWRFTGDAGIGVTWPASRYRPSWPGMTDIGRWFTDHFMDRYGAAPPDTAMSAFTDVTVIAAGLEAAAENGLGQHIEDQREALMDALESRPFQTWRGPVEFTRGDPHWHHSPPELMVYQYQRAGQNFDDAAVVYPPEFADAAYLPPRQ